MNDWSALENAAAAMRRLNRAVAGFDAPDVDLLEVARVATELSQHLETSPIRHKDVVLPSASTWADADVGDDDDKAGASDELEFDPFSLGGGRLSPASIGVEFRRDGPTAVTARCTVDGMFQGPPGRVHGGVVALIVDEVMAMAVRMSARRAFTVRLHVHLRAPAPIDVELRFRAWEHHVEGRKVVIHAEGRSDEGLFVEADALFIQVPQ